MTKKYRYLGYGTTNGQGIAKLDHDKDGNTLTNSYTGVGAGELDLIASTDNPTDISSDSFQSDPSTLWDTLWYDNATNGDYNENVIIAGSPTISRNTNGTTITAQNNNWANYRPSNDGTNFVTWNTPIIVEYDLIEVNTDSRIEIYNSNSIRTQTTYSNYSNPAGHYRHEIGLTSQKVYKDNTLIQETNIDFTGKNFRVDIMVWNNQSITLKNIKVYLL